MKKRVKKGGSKKNSVVHEEKLLKVKDTLPVGGDTGQGHQRTLVLRGREVYDVLLDMHALAQRDVKRGDSRVVGMRFPANGGKRKKKTSQTKKSHESDGNRLQNWRGE